MRTQEKTDLHVMEGGRRKSQPVTPRSWVWPQDGLNACCLRFTWSLMPCSEGLSWSVWAAVTKYHRQSGL
jgi:hypothetical protein